MKKFAVTISSLFLLANPTLFAGEVFRVVDEDGQITFTDSPAANTKSETINLPAINIAIAPSPRAIEGNDEATEDEVPYTSARITQPLNNATIPPGQTNLVVELGLKPALQEGHLAQLYIDGRTQGAASASTTFSISGLNRGEHKVRIEILGADKKRKAKTTAVTFHVKQHSANN
ncbi:MAG: hypothetical protein COA75_01110 [Cellvibrionales bacterium]|nr:MAG: hypothetical protein COA75_01110 [Cellvibrionales bacterium]